MHVSRNSSFDDVLDLTAVRRSPRARQRATGLLYNVKANTIWVTIQGTVAVVGAVNGHFGQHGRGPFQPAVPFAFPPIPACLAKTIINQALSVSNPIKSLDSFDIPHLSNTCASEYDQIWTSPAPSVKDTIPSPTSSVSAQNTTKIELASCPSSGRSHGYGGLRMCCRRLWLLGWGWCSWVSEEVMFLRSFLPGRVG